MSLKEARDLTPEELEMFNQAEARDRHSSKLKTLQVPKQSTDIAQGSVQVDPGLADKPVPQATSLETRELTMDDMLGLNQPTEQEAFETFKFFKQQGAFKSEKGVSEMVTDGFSMIGDSLGAMAKTFPERFASNFVEYDYTGIKPKNARRGWRPTEKQKKLAKEQAKKKRINAVSTQLQMLGEIKLGYEQLWHGGKRVLNGAFDDEESDADLRQSYDFWKKINEIEKERQVIHMDLAANDFLMMGGDQEIRQAILDGKGTPDMMAAMGGSIAADPGNFLPVGASFKAGANIFSKGYNKFFRGQQTAILNQAKEDILKQAALQKAAEFGQPKGIGAFGKTPTKEAVAEATKVLDERILSNLDKVKSMSASQRQSLLEFAQSRPIGHPLRKMIEGSIKGVPVGEKGRLGKAFSYLSPDKVAGVGLQVGGKVVENAGNMIKFLSELPSETAITIAMKAGIPEEKAVALFQQGIASKLVFSPLGYGAGTYAVSEFLTDDEMLSLMATGTVVGLPFLARYGRDASIIGKQLTEPATELTFFQRLGAQGRDTVTNRAVNRDSVLETAKSTMERSFAAGEGKVISNAFDTSGRLSGESQVVIDALNKTKIGRTVEGAGRLARETARGGGIGLAFGYVAGGGEMDEATYGGLGAGMAFGGGAYAASKPFRMVAGKSVDEIVSRRYGSWQYFTKNLLPKGQEESFGAMTKGEQIAYANASMAYPNVVFKFEAKGKDEKGGRHYRIDDTTYIEVNTDSAWAIEPLLRHEISHYLEDTGGARQMTDLLLGNHILEKKGLFTRLDKDGNPVMRRDGKGYKGSAELDNYKYEYGKYFFEPDKPRQEVIDAIPDDVIVREIVAEHGADYFMYDKRRYQDLHQGVTGAMIESLVSSSMLKNVPFMRNMLAKLGGTFREDGLLMSPNGVFSKMERIPAVTELIRKYNRQIEGLSVEQVQKKFPYDDGERVVDITGAEFAKNPELVENLRAGTFMRIDENGNIVADTAMTPAQQKKYNKDFSDAISDAIRKKDQATGLASGHVREIENDKGVKSFQGRFLDDQIIDEVAARGGWNKEQINLFREINGGLREGKNKNGGDDWMLSYFKATAKGGGKYVNAKVQNVIEVPYGIEITQKGNINIRTVSVDQLVKNIDKIFKQQKSEAARLFGTSNTKDAFMDAMDQYHRNHAEGKHGWANLDPNADLAREKANFINAMFGKSSKAHADANPWLNTLDSGAKSKNPRPVYRSRRIERIGKATQLSGERHVDSTKIINNLMPPKVQARTREGLETISTREVSQRKDIEQINLNISGRPMLYAKDEAGQFSFLDDALAKEGVENLANSLKEKDMQKRITKGWEAVTNTSKSFRVPTTKSKNIEKITAQASGEKIVSRPFADNDSEGFILTRPEDKDLSTDNLTDYILAYEDKYATARDGYGTLYVDSSNAPQKGKGFGFTAYQIILDYAASNKLVYQPGDLTFINQLRTTSAMLSSALKHKSTKHLRLDPDTIYSGKDLENFGKSYEQDVSILALLEMKQVKRRFPEVDNFDYNFKTGKFSEKGKPISDKRLQEQLMSDDRKSNRKPFTDGVGLATAKRAIITNKLFQAQVKDQGQVTDKIFKEGNLDGIAYMPPTSKAFKNWFGNSKVVDEKGKPLVVYHGTDRDFNSFDPKQIGSQFDGYDKIGFFFTTDKYQAEGFAHGFMAAEGYEPKNPKGKVLETYLNIEKPLTANIVEKVTKDPFEKDVFGGFYYEKHKDQIEKLMSSGKYDGLILGDLFVATKPTQIKSATGNKGTFDPGNSDIRYMPPKAPFESITRDVLKDLEGDKKAIQAQLKIADYPDNPYQGSVALPARMGLVNANKTGMFKSYDDVEKLINKLVDKIEYYQKKYPEFTKRTASFYSDMGRTAFDMAKLVPMEGRSQYDIADLQLRFLALGSPRSAVAANMTKSARSIMGHYTDISGHKINPADQQVAAQETALDWKSGKHFEVLDEKRKGASDKVRNFYLNGLAELIDIAKADTSDAGVSAVSELKHRAAVTLDLIKPGDKLTQKVSDKLDFFLDGLATVDMWDMAAKEYAHPAYVIKSGRKTPNAKPFLWSIPKHRVISTMASSGKGSKIWKDAKKDMHIDDPAEMNFQQANSLQIDNINNWNETTWAERSKQGFTEDTKWSYYTLNDEGGLTPGGGGALYDAHQTVDGLLADMLNKRGHAGFFGKKKLVARNAQEILWALTKFENPLESNQKLVLFGDRFQHMKQAFANLHAGKGLDMKNISTEAQGILGAIMDTYNKTADQKFPFEVDTWGDSANARAVQGKVQSFGDDFIGALPEGMDRRSVGVTKITDAIANNLGEQVQKIADQYGEELVVQNVQKGFGGYTEDGAPAVTPNIAMTMRGNPETVKSVMMEISSALDQADGNVFRHPTIIELNDPKTKFNEAVQFDTKHLDKKGMADFFMDLNQIKDSDGESFLTGFTNTDRGMFIADQYYKPNRLHAEIDLNRNALYAAMKKHGVKNLNTEKLVAETFARGEKVGRRSSFQRGIHELVKSKVKNAQGRNYDGLPQIPDQYQKIIDDMHALRSKRLPSGELTKAKESLGSRMDLLLIEGKIDSDFHTAEKKEMGEILKKIKPAVPTKTQAKAKKSLLGQLANPKVTQSKKKSILWNMRSGYFTPKQFENKAKTLMGKKKSIDLIPKEVRQSAMTKKLGTDQNMYFTTPETSGKIKR